MTPVALVTGASAGIGAVVVRLLLERGWTVYAVARSAARLEAATSRGARGIVVDLGDERSLEVAVRRVLAEASRIDVLVNNAGYGEQGAVEDVPAAAARRQLEVNVLGAARLAQLVLPGMRERGRGRIVNVTSVVADLHLPLGGWYGASKAALGALTDSLRQEARPYGVRVVDVRPGPVSTGWQEREAEAVRWVSAGGGYSGVADRVAARALERGSASSTPERVARAVLAAATSPRPRDRYFVGRGVRLAHSALRLLPAAAGDALVRAYLAGPPARPGPGDAAGRRAGDKVAERRAGAEAAGRATFPLRRAAPIR
ncbi:SDR family NAD(P)-dependent oxidoreductase [Rothia sp. AR01]|uniref:SDR family NAD(P)-dependent oxidoreductase n=1 Tax=Rothia santali TaxID=2949643 RepID=A0A9X2HEI8_9MICC|nr:SDR family NAD(P)-dependent oxidoreductase [Rothia santali]MCP3425372.1 SDR family NAD(P)-dependent oxidoreductase [Rothia santali]